MTVALSGLAWGVPYSGSNAWQDTDFQVRDKLGFTNNESYVVSGVPVPVLTAGGTFASDFVSRGRWDFTDLVGVNSSGSVAQVSNPVYGQSGTGVMALYRTAGNLNVRVGDSAGTEYVRAQRFTARAGHNKGGVKWGYLRLKGVSSPAGSLQVSIHGDDSINNVPNSYAITSGGVQNWIGNNGSYTWVPFELNNPLYFKSGLNYWLVVKGDSQSSNVGWDWHQKSGASSFDNSAVSTDAGASWSTRSGQSFLFSLLDLPGTAFPITGSASETNNGKYWTYFGNREYEADLESVYAWKGSVLSESFGNMFPGPKGLYQSGASNRLDVLSHTGSDSFLYTQGRSWNGVDNQVVLGVRASTHSAGSANGQLFGFWNGSSTHKALVEFNTGSVRFVSADNTGSEVTNVTGSVTVNADNAYMIKWEPGSASLYYNNVLQATHVSKVPNTSLPAFLGATSGAVGQDLLVSHYAYSTLKGVGNNIVPDITVTNTGSTERNNVALSKLFSLEVSSSAGNKVPTFTLTQNTPSGINNAVVLANNFIDMQVTRNGSTETVLYGQVDSVNKFLRPARQIEYRGRGLAGKLVNRHLQKAYDNLDVMDVLTDALRSTLGDDLVCTSATSVTGKTLVRRRFANNRLIDIVQEQADVASSGGYDWSVDKDWDLRFYDKDSAVSTGVTLTTSGANRNIKRFSFEKNEGRVRNRVLFYGGVETKLENDQSTGMTTWSALHTTGYADEFTTGATTTDILNRIDLKLRFVGTPANLEYEIRKDNSGTPQGGEVIKVGNIGQSAVTDNALGTWVEVEFEKPVIANEKYWVCLKNQGSSSDYWMWASDGTPGTGSDTTASTTDAGVTWSVDSSSSNFGFKQYFGRKIGVKRDDATLQPPVKEMIVTNPTVVSRDEAGVLADGLLDFNSQVFDQGEVTSPGIIGLVAGQTVTVIVPEYSINDTYRIANLKHKVNKEVGFETVIELGLEPDMYTRKMQALSSEQQDIGLRDSSFVVATTDEAVTESDAVGVDGSPVAQFRFEYGFAIGVDNPVKGGRLGVNRLGLFYGSYSNL